MVSTEKNIIFLIGMMGVGKTTIAPIIAKTLGYKLLDTDLEVEKIAGKSCDDIVKSSSVDKFRKLETKVLKQIYNCRNTVVACGGGIILREENRKYLLQKKAIVIWIDMKLEEIHKRIKNELRPNLKGLNSKELKIKLNDIYQERCYIYSKLSDICVKSNTNDSPQKVADKIIQQIILNNYNLNFVSRQFSSQKQTELNPSLRLLTNQALQTLEHLSALLEDQPQLLT